MSTRITVLCWALPLQLLHFETVHEWPWIHEEHLQHCKEIDVAHKVDQEHTTVIFLRLKMYIRKATIGRNSVSPRNDIAFCRKMNQEAVAAC